MNKENVKTGNSDCFNDSQVTHLTLTAWTKLANLWIKITEVSNHAGINQKKNEYNEIITIGSLGTQRTDCLILMQVLFLPKNTVHECFQSISGVLNSLCIN